MMAAAVPAASERNLTPTVSGFGSLFQTVPGVTVLAQMLAPDTGGGGAVAENTTSTQ